MIGHNENSIYFSLINFFFTYRSQLSQYSSLDIGIAAEFPLRESSVPKPYAMKSLGISEIYFKP